MKDSIKEVVKKHKSMPKQKVEIDIFTEDAPAILIHYLDFIDKVLNGQVVPKELTESIATIITRPKLEDSKTRDEIISIVKEECLEIIGRSTLAFSFTKKETVKLLSYPVPPPFETSPVKKKQTKKAEVITGQVVTNTISKIFSSTKCMEHVIDSLRRNDSFFEIIDDKFILRDYVLDKINEYLEPALTPKKHKSYPSIYSIAVHAAYVLVAFGYTISEAEYEGSKGSLKGYTEALYNDAKYAHEKRSKSKSVKGNKKRP